MWSPVLSLYIQRCNHDRSATQTLTPISRCFKYIFSHIYPYFAQNGYKIGLLKNTPIFRIPSTLLLNHPYFRNLRPQGPEEKNPPLFQFRVQAPKKKDPFLREIWNDHAYTMCVQIDTGMFHSWTTTVYTCVYPSTPTPRPINLSPCFDACLTLCVVLSTLFNISDILLTQPPHR